MQNQNHSDEIIVFNYYGTSLFTVDEVDQQMPYDEINAWDIDQSLN